MLQWNFFSSTIEIHPLPSKTEWKKFAGCLKKIIRLYMWSMQHANPTQTIKLLTTIFQSGIFQLKQTIQAILIHRTVYTNVRFWKKKLTLIWNTNDMNFQMHTYFYAVYLQVTNYRIVAVLRDIHMWNTENYFIRFYCLNQFIHRINQLC